MSDLVKIKTISQFHQVNGLPAPIHPLISLVDYGAMYENVRPLHWSQHFYSISLKRNVVGKFRYGQLDYDFDEGLMSFFAPDQVLNIESHEMDYTNKPSGWILLIHPDFLWNTPLAKKMQQYEFFGYAINESLFLSEKEEAVIISILQNIEQEYKSNIDDFSKNIIISQIELLLSYAERFLKRQFLTREKNNHEIITRFEEVLTSYFKNGSLLDDGIPTVQEISDQLNITSNYLSSLLKHTTGQNTRQHIQNKLIELAKVKLSTTQLSVSEIAYELGFEHSQSFSKLFKSKTNQTPLEFRAAFN